MQLGPYNLTLAKYGDSGDFERYSIAWDVLTAATLRQFPTMLDMSQSIHLKPYALACLAALGAHARKNGQTIPLRPPRDQRCREHVYRMGLSDYFSCQSTPLTPHDTSAKITQLEDRPTDFSSRIMDIWDREFGGLNAGLKPVWADHLDEIIWNALTHSFSPIGCLVAGQAFPKRRRLEVAVVDLGITIRGHLTQNPQYVRFRTDQEAIKKATEDGVTGTVTLNRWREPNSGCGLANLRKFCEAGNGELTIISGSCLAFFGKHGQPKCTSFPGYFQGTLVNLRFFIEQTHPLTTVMEVF